MRLHKHCSGQPTLFKWNWRYREYSTQGQKWLHWIFTKHSGCYLRVCESGLVTLRPQQFPYCQSAISMHVVCISYQPGTNFHHPHGNVAFVNRPRESSLVLGFRLVAHLNWPNRNRLKKPSINYAVQLNLRIDSSHARSTVQGSVLEY